MAGLLTAFCLLALSSGWQQSATFDEPFHVTAGYTYWVTGDYRIHPTNGNLIQRWIALPLVALRPHLPSREQAAWWEPNLFGVSFARQFLYGSGNDADVLIRWGRAMVILLGAATGLLVYGWSRTLFGPQGAALSLALFAFCPNVLAHAGLATSDMGAALAFTGSILAWWRLLHRPTAGRLAASTLAAAALALVKYSAPLGLVMAALLAVLRLARGTPLRLRIGGTSRNLRGRARLALFVVGLGMVHLLVVIGLIWACYGFRYGALADAQPGRDRFSETWETVLASRSRLLTGAVVVAREHRLLPEAYLYGFAHTLRSLDGRPTYMRGQVWPTGRWFFFPYAFVVKTPLSVPAALLLAAGTLVTAARTGTRANGLPHRLYRLAPLLVLIGVYWGSALTSALNLGLRHVLPTFPALFILAGAATRAFPAAGRTRALVLAGVVLVHAVEGVRIWPHYLAYFNQLAGGPRQGYRHLADSSLDWGQDLPGLRRWLERHGLGHPGGDPVYLDYFGTALPDYHGIRAIPLRAHLEGAGRLTGGIYCVSATHLAGPYTWIGQWTPRLEAAFRRLLQGSEGPASRPPASAEEAERRETVLGYLRYLRLLARLRQREPDDQVGYSILIYRLTAEEATAAISPGPDAPAPDRPRAASP